MRVARTVLEQKIRERRLSIEEFAREVERFAREHKESGTLSVRHLQRLIAGHRPGGGALGTVRPATARLLESMLGLGIDELLAPPGAGGTSAAIRVQAAPGRDRAVKARGGRSIVGAGCSWVDARHGWPAGTSWARVEELASRLDRRALAERNVRRAQVARSQIVAALHGYYGSWAARHRPYVASVNGPEIVTSIVTRPDWWRRSVPMVAAGGRLSLEVCPGTSEGRYAADERLAGAEIQRLAEIAVSDSRATEGALYRLLEIGPETAAAGSVGLALFVEYALTMDLLEGELLDAVAAGPIGSESLVLRRRYLPDTASILDIRSRLCVGGVLALCAIARPADPYRGPADYALLVQERSDRVLNAAGRLAVIPKGFHQPLTDAGAEAHIEATLLRELEEELFGRAEVDSTRAKRRVLAPMHPSRLSEPLRWLLDSGRLRMECTGFGLNLVSGNYEFACLVVIEDEEFWTRYGGVIEANWESSQLRQYSSLDCDLLTELIEDEAWSNEGLFALLQGIRRLAEIGGHRVRLPTVNVLA